MRDPRYQREYEKMRSKYPIPMRKQDLMEFIDLRGEEELNARRKKWEEFKEKWGIVFWIKSVPVLKDGSGGKSERKA